jgi:cytochrome bd-type quinol oxidase subunit 1
MLDNLTAAREWMALSLGFHIIFTLLGVGPALSAVVR